MLSLAPLTVLTLAIVTFVFSRQVAQEKLMVEVNELMGPQVSVVIEGVLRSAQVPSHGLIASSVSFLILLVSASGVLSELRDSLNLVWDTQPKNAKGIRGFVRYRIVSFAMVLGVGFVLLVSLILSAALSVLGRAFSTLLPASEPVIQAINFGISFLFVALLFAMMFKFIPDRTIPWSDVWVGAAVTALLFDIGKTLLGLYLGKTAAVNVYGAAGSVVALLIWVYYSAQILYFGAEFAQQYTCLYGSRSVADPCRRRNATGSTA
jgi:membrane protein